MPESPESVKTIFGRAAEIESEAERAKYLDEACAGDETLRAEVEDLLGAIQRAGNFLGGSPSDTSTLDYLIAEGPGTVIGPYKLLQKIGEGGFGIVYMADQTAPVKRRVALKIIKPGMDSRQVVARFEAERQALAMMDHPNIARVLDAGTTASGRPYFVMQLVKGVPITQYCDEKRLTTRQRLELFVPVCHALQHAHQKGIIHRDIKPSNVLVGEYDDRAVPRIIDFGVAKATEQRLTEKTMFTAFGQVVGTIDYMSPEQAKLNELDIDTRSDIYSLGVLLYELLAGETPFDRQRLRSAAFDELLRIIREEEPPRPSLRLSTSASLPSIAANRHVEPNKLSALVRGELDWIVMKALEKERSRRYETADGLAADIQRHLNDEPVTACPPSAGYRFRKFARRNKVAFLTTVVVLLVLFLGITCTTWQAIVATRQRNRAVEAERLAAEQLDRAIRAEGAAKAEAARANLETDRAEEALTTTQAVNDFLRKDLLSAADPRNEPDRDIKLRTVLDRAAEKIDDRFADQPLIEAAVRHTLGETYLGLGDYENAQRHFERAWEIRRRVLGPESPQTLFAMHGTVIALAHQEHLEAAEKLCRDLLEKAKRVLSPEDPNMLSFWNAFQAILWQQGHLQEAEQECRSILEARRRMFGDDHQETLPSVENLAVILDSLGNYEEAEDLLRETLERYRRVLTPEHPSSLRCTLNLVGNLTAQKRFAEAEALCRESLDISHRVLGPEHRETLKYAMSLALIVKELGNPAEAETISRTALDMSRRVLGPEHSVTLGLVRVMAGAIGDQDRHQEAEELLREVLEIQRHAFGDEHPYLLCTMNGLAAEIQAQGRLEEALPFRRAALELSRRVTGLESAATLLYGNNLAATTFELGRYEEAESLRRELLEIRRRIQGSEHSDTLTAAYNLSKVFLVQNRYEEAESLLRELLQIRRRVSEPNDPEALISIYLLGIAVSRQGHYEEAAALFKRGLELAPDVPDSNSRTRVDFAGGLAVTYSKWAASLTTAGTADARDLEKAIELAGKAIELQPDKFWYRLHRAEAFLARGQFGEAIADCDKACELAPESEQVALIRAQMLLIAGRTGEYRQTCRELLDTFGQSDKPGVGIQTARACTLAPNAISDPTEVVRLAERASSHSPGHWKTHVLAMSRLRAGELEQAEQTFQESLAMGPGWMARFLNWLGMGLVCAQQGNSDKAGEYLRQAIELSNESPSDYMEDRLECRLLRRELESLLEASRTARDAISQGEFEEAVACFEKAIECEANNATHALIRTQLLVLTERMDEYRQACGEMLDRFGQSADPINLNIAARACALAPQAIADPGKAVELAQRAVTIDPSAPLYHRVLGLTQLRAGQLDQAVDSFQESLRKPSIPPVMQLLNWFGLALACQQRGELDEARAWQEKALKSLDLADGALLQSSLEVELLRQETESLLGIPEREGDDDQMEQQDVSVNEKSP